MKIGKVIGTIVATRKEGNLGGLKILVVTYLDENLSDTKHSVACIDTVGAGEGDVVLLLFLFIGTYDTNDKDRSHGQCNCWHHRSDFFR